jgi:hypothetical protein
MLEQQIEAKRALGIRICECLKTEIDKLGFADNVPLTYPLYDSATFVPTKDPYTGDVNLTAYWYSERDKQRIGRLQFNSDGSFYAEYDVVKPHPVKTQWFIDAVSAWGKEDMIKSEAKLIPMLEDA